MRRMMNAEAAAALARGEVLTETSEENDSSAISDDDEEEPPALERAPLNSAAAPQRQTHFHQHQGKQLGRPPQHHQRNESFHATLWLISMILLISTENYFC